MNTYLNNCRTLPESVQKSFEILKENFQKYQHQEELEKLHLLEQTLASSLHHSIHSSKELS